MNLTGIMLSEKHLSQEVTYYVVLRDSLEKAKL